MVDVMRFKDVSGMLLCELEKLFGVDEVAAGLLEARKYKLPINNIIFPPTPPTAAAAAASPPLPGDRNWKCCNLIRVDVAFSIYS